MKTTREYLDAVKEKLNLPSDYAAAKALCVTRATVSKWRLGLSVPDDLACARIADALGIEPIEVIAATQFERSSDEQARRLWEGIWGKAVGATAMSLIACAVGVSVAPTSKAAESGNSPAENSQIGASFHVMSNRKRRRAANDPRQLAA